MGKKNGLSIKNKLMLGGFWLKIIVIVGVAYIAMQKDVNLEFNFESPLKSQVHKHTTPEKAEGETKEEGLSDSKGQKPSGLGFTASLAQLVGLKQKHKTPNIKDVDQKMVDAYIQRFSGVATSEKRKFNIPASIIIATSLYQSVVGSSPLSKQQHNYFTIPCTKDWDGMMKDVDGTCFRKYESAWAGFRGFSHFISNEHPSLQKIHIQNYEKWAKELQAKCYSHDKKFAKNIMEIIEKYDLGNLD
ncbi:MAG: glucosaminidase domain-containing protein [Saprospiraceae bacterium]